MKDVLYTLYVGMFISAKRNSFQNTLCIQSQRIYGQIIYIKLCKVLWTGCLRKGMEEAQKEERKENRGNESFIQRDVSVQYCGYNTK